MLRKTGVSKKTDIAKKEMGRQEGGKCWRRQESARRRTMLERTGVGGRNAGEESNQLERGSS
jgi:hypothetical protein